MAYTANSMCFERIPEALLESIVIHVVAEDDIVACLLKVRIVKPRETVVARERLRKHGHC
jgi:hypothetical protein